VGHRDCVPAQPGRGHQGRAGEIEQALIALQNAQNGGLTVRRRHCGDAQIEISRAYAHARATVLRQAAFGDIKAARI